MGEKRISVRLAAVGGEKLKAELVGIGKAGKQALAAVAGGAAPASQGLKGVGAASGSALAQLEALAARATRAATALRAAGASTGTLVERIDRVTGVTPGFRRSAEDIAAYGRALDDTRAKFNPLFATIRDYRSKLAEIRQAHAVGAISADEMRAAISRERQATLQSIAAIKGRTTALTGMGRASRMAAFQSRMLMFQLNDVFVSLASGMSPMMVFIQQGAQIQQIYAGQGGVRAALAQTARMIGNVVTRFPLLTAAIAAGTAAVAGMRHEINRTSEVAVSFGDTALAVWQVVRDGLWQKLKPAIDAIAPWFAKGWEMVVSGTKIALNGIIKGFLIAKNDIAFAWASLPEILGAAVVGTANAVIGGLEWMVNTAIEKINWLADQVNALMDKAGAPEAMRLGRIGSTAFPRLSLDATGKLAFGGTPSDATVVEAIKEIRARGLRVTFYPFLLMDIPAGNTLPNPYSDNAAGVGQDAYPWRGRITCSPAAGFVGTVDKTTAAGTQVSAFFGNASAADFSVSGETVSWVGGNDWGYRRFILHYAHLCAAVGGVDAFLLGSELKGLTTIRDGASTYPAVNELKRLAGDVANLVTVSTGTASLPVDFSSLHLVAWPGDNPSGVLNSPAPQWEGWQSPPPTVTASSIDTGPVSGRTIYKCFDVLALGISVPDIDAGSVTLSVSASQSWQWGGARLRIRAYGLPDTGGAPDTSWPHPFAPLILDVASDTSGSVTSNTTAGSGTLPAGTRWVQIQVIITDGIQASNFSFRLSSSNATITSGHVGYAADWSEYFGHHPGDGSNDLFFHLDPLWSDPDLHFIGIDNYLPLSDWRDGTNHLDAQAGWAGIRDLGYLRANIEGGEQYDWFYASSADRTAQVRTPITDTAYGKPWVFRPKDIRSWWSNQHYNRPGGVENPTPTAWVPESKPIRFTELGCPVVDRGTNQPNVFFDPKSSESALPYYSRGWQDEALQRRYLEAMLGYWNEPANNPVSSVTGKPMIDMAEAAVWTWDARPFPDFPAREDIWADAPNWRLGHWLTGRLGAVGLGALVRDLCRAAGLPDTLVDVSELSDIVPGFVVSALESPRASIATLARHFGFDAIETGGRIVFRARGRAAVATIAPDQMVANGAGEVMELSRGQETELPQALKWQLVRADEEYDTATVEARRTTVQAARISSESFPLAVSLEEADRRCRRALMEAWVGRETLTAKLPPSLLRLDPGDVIALAHDGRLIDYRITHIADAGARAIEAIRSDAKVYDLPPGQYRPASLPSPTVFGPAEVALMDLPQISDSVPAHRPYAAVFAKPWYGTAAVWRSASTSGFALLESIGTPAHMGTLAADLPAGPLWRFDAGSELLVDLSSGPLVSVTDTELLNGANALAVESAPGVWEIIQFGNAELVSAGRYRLTRLLRGQRGTEDAMGNPSPSGARVVVLDSAVQSLPISEGDLGLPWNWRIGPGNAAPTDVIMQALTFTPAGRGLIPFAPAQARMRRLANGDLAIRWIRRDRALSADSWVLADAPMSEASEIYDLEILSGGTVVRTVAGLTAPSFLYTVAMQTADFGGAVTSLDLRIYQIGVLGRGVPFSTTLAISEAL